VYVCFLWLILFIVGIFVVLVSVLFLSLPPTSCQDSQSSFPSLLVLSSVSEKSAGGISAVFVGASWDVWIV
jgi:hypothetical protein